MSMNFKEPINKEQQEMIKELVGRDSVKDIDEHVALIQTNVIDQKNMSVIANKLNQVVTYEINDTGEVKTMSDGTKYKCTAKGWETIND